MIGCSGTISTYRNSTNNAPINLTANFFGPKENNESDRFLSALKKSIQRKEHLLDSAAVPLFILPQFYRLQSYQRGYIFRG
jgi:hypothetical protein